MLGVPRRTKAPGLLMKLRVTKFWSSVVVGIWWPVVDLLSLFRELVNLWTPFHVDCSQESCLPHHLVGTSRTRSLRVESHEDVSWRRKRFRARDLCSHGGRCFGASGDGSNRVPSKLSRTSAGAVQKTSVTLVCSFFFTQVLTVVSVTGRRCD